MLELPWPPKQLNPNFKRANHWTKYHKQTKRYRQDCAWLAKFTHMPCVEDGVIPLEIIFHPPDRRKRDDDGIIGAFKAGRDGLADAWGVDDNVFKPTYKIAGPVKNGKIIVKTLDKQETNG